MGRADGTTRSGERIEALLLPAAMALEIQLQRLQCRVLVDRARLATFELGTRLVEQGAQFAPVQPIQIHHPDQPVALITLWV